jgi:hypothetical protein
MSHLESEKEKEKEKGQLKEADDLEKQQHSTGSN